MKVQNHSAWFRYLKFSFFYLYSNPLKTELVPGVTWGCFVPLVASFCILRSQLDPMDLITYSDACSDKVDSWRSRVQHEDNFMLVFSRWPLKVLKTMMIMMVEMTSTSSFTTLIPRVPSSLPPPASFQLSPPCSPNLRRRSNPYRRSTRKLPCPLETPTPSPPTTSATLVTPLHPPSSSHPPHPATLKPHPPPQVHPPLIPV